MFTVLFIAPMAMYAQVPKLSSYPSAAATLFIDFDGHTVKGSSWNWAGPIYALPAELNNTAITEIFNRVSEDYRPFNLNVTTDSTVYLAAPFNKRMRIIVTPTSQWYGSAGGVAYVGSFIWGDETPGWVFSTLLGNSPKVVAEAISHEAGHTFGLHHQSDYNDNCQKIADYAVGTGTGEIGWAPIMGVGYYRNLTTWHNGTSALGCNHLQNDLEIIAGPLNGFGFRGDDHDNSASAQATKIMLEGQEFLVDGIINRTGDVDAFKVNIAHKSGFKLNAIPENVGTGNNGANVDIRIRILNSTQDTIGVYNPSTLLNAGIDTALNPGVYYVLVDGVGNANNSNYGSLGYYSMTGMLATVLPVHEFKLSGNSGSGDHILNWNIVSDEPLKNIVVEASDNGEDFHSLVTLSAAARKFNYKAIKEITYYRLKAITADNNEAYYSNIITLRSNGQQKAVSLLSNIVTNTVTINSNGNYPYQLIDATGKVVAKGTLRNGINQIPTSGTLNGLLFLRLSDGQVQWTEKLLKQ